MLLRFRLEETNFIAVAKHAQCAAVTSAAAGGGTQSPLRYSNHLCQQGQQRQLAGRCPGDEGNPAATWIDTVVSNFQHAST